MPSILSLIEEGKANENVFWVDKFGTFEMKTPLE